MGFMEVIGIINAVIAAGQRALPLIAPLKEMIENAFKDEALTPEQRAALHQAVRDAQAQMADRVPLREKYPDPRTE